MSGYLADKPVNADKQLKQIKNIMLDGQWHNKYEMSEKTGIELSSTDSRRRDLKLQKYGGYKMLKKKEDYEGFHRVFWFKIIPSTSIPSTLIQERLFNE